MKPPKLKGPGAIITPVDRAVGEKTPTPPQDRQKATVALPIQQAYPRHTGVDQPGSRGWIGVRLSSRRGGFRRQIEIRDTAANWLSPRVLGPLKLLDR